MQPSRLILASASPRRVDLLRQMSLDFEIVPSQAREVHPAQLTPREIAQINAYRKARSVAKDFQDALVLGADTIVCLDQAVYGKPTSLEDAARMLEELQARTHEVITGVCLIQLRSHYQRLFAESTRVTFQRLTADSIRDYLSLINPLDKAGAYAIQEHGDRIVQQISGSYSNVVGLPVERLKEELEKWGSTTARRLHQLD